MDRTPPFTNETPIEKATFPEDHESFVALLKSDPVFIELYRSCDDTIDTVIIENIYYTSLSGQNLSYQEMIDNLRALLNNYRYY